ncbi:MAG: hypothetical protein LBH44_04665 [Treponema sp.]|jgi:hypothetical protein|nr:hypothetical protein [Treponema sp.]
MQKIRIFTALTMLAFAFVLTGCENPASSASPDTKKPETDNPEKPETGNPDKKDNLIPITSAEIIVIAPVKGATPDTTASGTGNFSIGAVSWSPANSPFFGGAVYTAKVTLTANNGYTFTGLNSASINGQNASVSNNTGMAVTLSYTFSATDTRTITGITIKTQPSRLTYTHGEQLDLSGLAVTLTFDDTHTEDVAAADFTAKHITAIPAHDNHLNRSTHNEHPVTITYGGLTPLTTGNLTIARAAGATVNAPALNSTTYNSITINAVTAPDNGQSVEYGINTSNNASTATWQAGLIFTGLNEGTTYFIFARSVQNDNYNSGVTNGFLEARTRSNHFHVTNTTQWGDALSYIKTGGNGTAGTPNNYTITVDGDVPVPGNTANSFGTVSNVTITINGNGKLYLTSQGSLLTIGNSQTVYIDSDQLTLQGLRSGQNDSYLNNNQATVFVEKGTLVLQNGTISDNGRGGVDVYGGAFTMQGSASVSGNSGGRGVSVSGTFTMQDNASVFGNTGGGVAYYGGAFGDSFTMKNNASVFGNTTVTVTVSNGGGVYIRGPFTNVNVFTMQDSATVSGNVSLNGGGVYVERGIFTMQDSATISGNTASGFSGTYPGGGVYCYVEGNLHMAGGIIYGNNVDSNSNKVIDTIDGSSVNGRGAALSGFTGYTEYGNFIGENWVRAGYLSTTDNTIRVVNGVLQSP